MKANTKGFNRPWTTSLYSSAWYALVQYHEAADQSHEVGHDGEQRKHDAGGDHARGHKFLDRIGAQRAHGVNLFGHFHGPEFASDAGCVAPRHQQRRQYRAKLANQRDGDDLPYLARGPVLIQRAGHLHGDDEAAEKADQEDDGQAADADNIHLDDHVVEVMRAAE